MRGRFWSKVGRTLRRSSLYRLACVIGVIGVIGLVIAALPATRARAGDPPDKTKTVAAPAGAAPGIPAALAARMEKEKTARKACKQAICRLLLQHKSADGSADGGAAGTLTCDVVKTWLKPTIEKKILRNKVSWPWQNAQCKTRLRLDRATLAGARAPGKHMVKLAKHTIACSLDRGAGKTFDVSFAVAPEVAFTDGKATTVAMHWSDIKAPTLAKGVIWSGTKLDNAFGVLEGSMVDAIAHFLDVSCKEVGVAAGQE